MNKVQLVGYLAEAPTVKNNGSVNYACLKMATDRFFEHENCKIISKVTYWHLIKVWGDQLIKRIPNCLCSGSHVMVEGMIEYHHYEGTDGKKHFSAVIRAERIIDLDR